MADLTSPTCFGFGFCEGSGYGIGDGYGDGHGDGCGYGDGHGDNDGYWDGEGWCDDVQVIAMSGSRASIATFAFSRGRSPHGVMIERKNPPWVPYQPAAFDTALAGFGVRDATSTITTCRQQSSTRASHSGGTAITVPMWPTACPREPDAQTTKHPGSGLANSTKHFAAPRASRIILFVLIQPAYK